MADIPQFAIPFALTPDGTGIQLVEQGTAVELAQRVNVLCRTPIGWLDGRPDFGLEDQAHLEGGADLLEIDRQLATHIPEAETLVQEDPSLMNESLDQIGVQVSAR
jgi:hypothetical protein